MRVRRRRSRGLAAVALVVLIVGCSSDPATAPAPSATTVVTGTVASDTTAAPTTAAPVTEPPPVRVVAVGDIACDPASEHFGAGAGDADFCHMRATSDLVVGQGYDAFLALGDLQYENGTFEAFQASYDPTWGRVKDITRPAPGNHEYNTPLAAGYYQYFGAAAGDPAKGYYSYDIGSWHFVALNSNCGVVSCDAGSEQEQWLRADLAAHPTACTIAYWHHPLFSSGEHGANPSVAPLYAAADELGVDVVLNGHDHHYEWFEPQDASGTPSADGIRQFVVGTGGKNHYVATRAAANSAVSETNTYGVLELTLHADRYEWRFVAEAGATFRDAGSADCN